MMIESEVFISMLFLFCFDLRAITYHTFIVGMLLFNHG